MTLLSLTIRICTTGKITLDMDLVEIPALLLLISEDTSQLGRALLNLRVILLSGVDMVSAHKVLIKVNLVIVGLLLLPLRLLSTLAESRTSSPTVVSPDLE